MSGNSISDAIPFTIFEGRLQFPNVWILKKKLPVYLFLYLKKHINSVLKTLRFEAEFETVNPAPQSWRSLHESITSFLFKYGFEFDSFGRDWSSSCNVHRRGIRQFLAGAWSGAEEHGAAGLPRTRVSQA